MIFYVSIWPSTQHYFIATQFFRCSLPTLIKHWAFIVNLKDHHFRFSSFSLLFLFFSLNIKFDQKAFPLNPKNFFFIVFLVSTNGMGLWHYTRCKGAKLFFILPFGKAIFDTYAQLNSKCYQDTNTCWFRQRI